MPFTQTRHPGGGLSWSETPSEEETLQLDLLKAEIANMKNEKTGNAETGKQAQKMSEQYLGQWNKGLEKAGGLYNTAIGELEKARTMVSGAYKGVEGDIDKAQGMVDKTYGDVTGELGGIGEEMKSEWNQMKTDFGGIKGDLMSGAKEDLAAQGQLRRQFMDLSKADYEGASGRAMADVAAQSEAGRQSEAMRMSGLGIDPTSGRSRSAMRTSRNQEALGKAMAGNQARIGEKGRVAGLTAQGLQLIDPNRNVNTVANIQGMQNNLLTSRSNMSTNLANIQSRLAGQTAGLASTEAGLKGNLAGQMSGLAQGQGNLAGNYMQNVVAPQGEMGAAQLGVAQATGTGGAGSPSGTAGAYGGQIGVKTIGKQANVALTPKVQQHLDSQAKAMALKKKIYG